MKNPSLRPKNENESMDSQKYPNNRNLEQNKKKSSKRIKIPKINSPILRLSELFNGNISKDFSKIPYSLIFDKI